MAAEHGLLVRLLDAILYFQGGLIFSFGVLYFVSSFQSWGQLPTGHCLRLARLLGLFGITAGVGQIIAGYTGGVAAYVRAGGPEAVGWAVFGFRAASAYFLVHILIDAWLLWLRRSDDDRWLK